MHYILLGFALLLFSCNNPKEQKEKQRTTGGFTSTKKVLLNTEGLKDTEEQDKTPAFHFNGKSSLSIYNQSRDTVKLELYHFSPVSRTNYNEKVFLPPTQKLEKSLRTDGLLHVQLKIDGKHSRLFTSPAAEISVEIRNAGDGNTLHFAGTHREVNNYLQEVARHFGQHLEERMAIYTGVNNEKSFSKLLFLIDSIFTLRHEFLQNAARQIPSWYLNYEQTRLGYAGAQEKLNARMYRKILLDKKDEVGRHFLEETASLPLNVPELVNSSEYHSYLNDYFFIKNDPDLRGFPKETTQQKKYVQNRFTLESKELKGIVKDVYLTGQLAERISKYRYLLDSSALNHVQDRTLNTYLHGLYIAKPLLPAGTIAPYFYLTNPEGSYFTPADFKGKVLLINFWATWCKPCIKEIPDENALVNEYKDKPVAVVNICMNSSTQAWHKLSQKHNVLAVNLFTQGNWADKISKDYGVSSWPHRVLIDQEGKVVMNHAPRASAIRPLIDSLLSDIH